MRLKRFGPKARRVGKPRVQPKEASPTGGGLLVRMETLIPPHPGLRQGGEDPMTPGFRRRLAALLQEAKARWGNLTPEERRRLLSLLAGLLSLLPLGRLGRVGLLLEKALGPGGQVAFSLLLRLLRR
ncbi:hypothetical protein [Thermus scotoductus]|nr:hypothetical protein [Thermus scotoductus]